MLESPSQAGLASLLIELALAVQAGRRIDGIASCDVRRYVLSGHEVNALPAHRALLVETERIARGHFAEIEVVCLQSLMFGLKFVFVLQSYIKNGCFASFSVKNNVKSQQSLPPLPQVCHKRTYSFTINYALCDIVATKNKNLI